MFNFPLCPWPFRVVTFWSKTGYQCQCARIFRWDRLPSLWMRTRVLFVSFQYDVQRYSSEHKHNCAQIRPATKCIPINEARVRNPSGQQFLQTKLQLHSNLYSKRLKKIFGQGLENLYHSCPFQLIIPSEPKVRHRVRHNFPVNCNHRSECYLRLRLYQWLRQSENWWS